MARPHPQRPGMERTILKAAEEEVSEVVGGALLEDALGGQAIGYQCCATDQDGACAGARRGFMLADALHVFKLAHNVPPKSGTNKMSVPATKNSCVISVYCR